MKGQSMKSQRLMNKSLLLVAAIIMTGSFVFLSCAGAHGNGMHGSDTHEYFLFKAKKELKLTEQQMEALKKIIDEVKVKASELHSNSAEHFQEIKSLITAESLSERDILAFMDKGMSKHEELMSFAAGKIAELHAILTPEQREKIVKHLETLMKKMDNKK